MKFLGSAKRHAAFWPIVIVFFAVSKLSTCTDLRLSLDCMFSGLLALTGFVFTARTFITFKLNEDVYSNSRYREYVKKLQQEGAITSKLYEPLRRIDNNLGDATYMCLWATGLFLIVAFLPKTSSIALDPTHKVESVLEILTDPGNLQLARKNPDLLKPFAWKAFTDLTIIYFVFCLYQMVITTRALHKNIQAIINHWEDDYDAGDPPKS